MNARIDPDTLEPVRNRWRRPLLMLALPLVLVAAGLWLWLTGGQSVTTDNAYVQQDKVSISSDVTGRVIAVGARESQKIRRGDLLIRIDPRPFEIALAQAEANLAAARLQAAELRSGTTGKTADVAGKRDAVTFARQELDRQQTLLKDGFTTRARVQSAEYAMAKAVSELNSAVADEASARAAANGAGTGTHPLVLSAMAARDKAAFELSRTEVRAPSDGIASQTSKVLPGQVLVSGIPTMSLVLSGRRWIEANFKETDLEHMRVGQRATVKLDAYPGQPIAGRVESIGAGTGSEFSVLPAQNATGNWVKVVQRVPVRIALPDDAPGAPAVPLIAGLSAKVTVETPK
ncbi:HlyD family secretion protein [Polymorphobacter fuscus]|uniref:HlyD family efflux transporter periplasmic adaptor subunit n=1 Tax=Sandarakinorhabdus fusca TaxID=1439888 RepID=A0A7C9KGM4_9SPHN|nr:HlyD family secretion protein [Polymorphobacter fuscus]KAB7648292.1 HlyD family secretion protein [Polymorphobacter fuscus]MQT15801.1 HlyD family efflux transporter periplasmic adaptor subunit [Polymorphobacter fuscus]NJC07926.1 membrane fusion protein (multidrug efflux system) [Polymorphobacter fuscus]